MHNFSSWNFLVIQPIVFWWKSLCADSNIQFIHLGRGPVQDEWVWTWMSDHGRAPVSWVGRGLTWVFEAGNGLPPPLSIPLHLLHLTSPCQPPHRMRCWAKNLLNTYNCWTLCNISRGVTCAETCVQLRQYHFSFVVEQKWQKDLYDDQAYIAWPMRSLWGMSPDCIWKYDMYCSETAEEQSKRKTKIWAHMGVGNIVIRMIFVGIRCVNTWTLKMWQVTSNSNYSSINGQSNPIWGYSSKRQLCRHVATVKAALKE